MDFPLTLHFGSNTLYVHPLLEAAAFFVGFRYFLFLRKRRGDLYSSTRRTYVIIGAIFGALAGSRLVGALERPHELLLSDNLFWYVYSNKTVVGGFLGGLFGVEGMKKLMGEQKASGDLFVYPMILGLVIGRLGCFSMGVYEETYGLPTTFFAGMDLGDGLLRHPVALYEIFFLLLLWMALYRVQKTIALENGALFKLFLITYLLFRLLLDFLKPHHNLLVGCSTIQLTCLLGLVYYFRYLIRPKKLLATAYA